ncbi:hypothetical protein [Myxococcus sp. SDU36]|uniref:hypothetical protein n=1 Tax=Myxococcus sp. SDU36 TaxID=2831967 RepID=UPI002542E2E6|nr:hypothetical protein [Myxococcus sp. SDU36]WIG95696.1 hypothetical protein KGD87_35390 [Myxococcus sp. SDU36]
MGRELVERVLTWLPTGSLELAADETYSCSTVLEGLPQRLIFGQSRQVDCKELVARWKSAAGARMLKIVIWSTEVLLRDLKQLLGFADSRARRRLAVLRTAPFAGLSYTLRVLWYMELATHWQQLKLPLRPWYTTKATVSFADVLRLAQSTLARTRWHSPRRIRANVRAVLDQPGRNEHLQDQDVARNEKRS